MSEILEGTSITERELIRRVAQSTYAHRLCVELSLDPDEKVRP